LRANYRSFGLVCQAKSDYPAYLRRDCGQDVVVATVGSVMGVWAQEGCGSGDSARRLDLARRAENPRNMGRAIP